MKICQCGCVNIKGDICMRCGKIDYLDLNTGKHVKGRRSFEVQSRSSN